MTTLGTETKTSITLLGHEVPLYEQNTSYLQYLKETDHFELNASYHRTHGTWRLKLTLRWPSAPHGDVPLDTYFHLSLKEANEKLGNLVDNLVRGLTKAANLRYVTAEEFNAAVDEESRKDRPEFSPALKETASWDKPRGNRNPLSKPW